MNSAFTESAPELRREIAGRASICSCATPRQWHRPALGIRERRVLILLSGLRWLTLRQTAQLTSPLCCPQSLYKALLIGC